MYEEIFKKKDFSLYTETCLMPTHWYKLFCVVEVKNTDQLLGVVSHSFHVMG